MVMTGVFDDVQEMLSKGFVGILVLGFVMLVVFVIVGIYQGVKKGSWSVLKGGVASSMLIIDCAIITIYACNYNFERSIGWDDYILVSSIVFSVIWCICLIKGGITGTEENAQSEDT